MQASPHDVVYVQAATDGRGDGVQRGQLTGLVRDGLLGFYPVGHVVDDGVDALDLPAFVAGRDGADPTPTWGAVLAQRLEAHG